MITSTDTANILYEDCALFGMPVYQEGNVPKGPIEAEGRAVIHTREQSSETFWKKGFVEVNLFVPDTASGKADLIRLNDLERLAVKSLKSTGSFDGTPYRYTVASTRILENEILKAHYVNVKVLFRVINIME